jgi:hypothetical protein
MKTPTPGRRPGIGAQFDVSHFANKANDPWGQERRSTRQTQLQNFFFWIAKRIFLPPCDVIMCRDAVERA